jgi:hypothetical protein
MGRHREEVVSRVPGWPLVRFSIPYFLQLGYLEGRVGFIYRLNLAYYEFLIQIKMREIKSSHLSSLSRKT